MHLAPNRQGQQAKALTILSTESMHGHRMEAMAAVEFIASLLALRHGFAPPTVNLHRSDPQCDVDYVVKDARVELCLEHGVANCFAFSARNAVLIDSRASA